jgi:ABC-type transport system involved in multi-copper enzyme maturation permease subunit
MATFSLVWKDAVAAQRLLWLVIPLGTVQLAVLALVPGLYPLAALTFAALLGFGSIAVEEAQRTELLWNSLPVSRGEFVTARYLTTLIGIVAGLAFGWALSQAVTRLAAEGPSALLRLGAHALMFTVLVLGAAVYLPLYFRFGAGRGALVFSAAGVVALLVISLVTQSILLALGYPSPIADPDAWRAAAPTLMTQTMAWVAPQFGRLLTAFVGFSFITMGVSWLISRRVYEARDL